MRIHLLRHGQFGPDDGHRTDGYSDPDLNDVGTEQARALGARLRRYPSIDTLYTSDLRRTTQTAGIVAQALGVTPRVEPRFREIYRGELEDKTWEMVAEKYPEFYREWTRREIDVPYPNGESAMDVWKRASAAVDEIVKAHAGDVGIVTHGGRS